MGTGEQQIECRNCREVIPLDAGNCPNCGTSIRSLTAPVVAIVIGLIVAVGSLTDLDNLGFYGLIGLAMVGIGGFLIYDRRRRTL